MAETISILSANVEFEDFLSALIGEQKNGMPVSVFSALARLNIDPWGEARRLSELPKDRAIQALRGSIDALADLHWAKIDAAGIAARLIRLLPNHGARTSGREIDNIVIRPGRTVQPSWSAYLFDLASRLPMAAWLAIGAVVLIASYAFG